MVNSLVVFHSPSSILQGDGVDEHLRASRNRTEDIGCSYFGRQFCAHDDFLPHYSTFRWSSNTSQRYDRKLSWSGDGLSALRIYKSGLSGRERGKTKSSILTDFLDACTQLVAYTYRTSL